MTEDDFQGLGGLTGFGVELAIASTFFSHGPRSFDMWKAFRELNMRTQLKACSNYSILVFASGRSSADVFIRGHFLRVAYRIFIIYKAN